MTANAMTISRLAAAAGVHVETVRYYQRRGLLREPSRAPGSVRRYGIDDVSRLQFIRRAQAMGFSLDEITGLLEVKGQHACEQTRLLTERKLIEVRQRLQDLRRLEVELEKMVGQCHSVASGAACPTLDLLVHASEPAVRAKL